MRYEKGHKEVSRSRILETAAKRFRREGIAAVGIASLMKDAGLTHGGFYSHFASKESLAGEALALALETTTAKLAGAAEKGGIEGLIASYLSPGHRDHPEMGCAIAAAAAEVARHPEVTREALTHPLEKIVELIAQRLEGDDNSRRRRAMALFSSMMGTLQLARMVSDPAFSDEILSCGAEAALLLAQPAAAQK